MPSVLPSPSPSPMPSSVPTPSPSANPVVPTLMPSPSPSELPTTPVPSPNPSLMPSPAPSPLPSVTPTPGPTELPTTPIPSVQPSLMPSPSPSPMPSLMPSPLPSPSPTVMPSPTPTDMPTVTCLCLEVYDPEESVSDFVGVYRHMNNYSPNTNKWRWERMGDNTLESIYFSHFGSADARWVIKGYKYGEWAETSAGADEPTPPVSTSWLLNLEEGSYYHRLFVNCSQCEITPAPTPDPTESPTNVPTSLVPTVQPTPLPTVYCRVLNITDLSNGYYTGYFEMQVLLYNGKHKWKDEATGESLFWVDSAMFEYEGPVENIWIIGYTEEEGEKDSHFLVYSGNPDDYYPYIDSTDDWLEYTFDAYSNQNSSVVINCEETELPTLSPTVAPTEPLCTELYVWTCCDPVYTGIDGIYRAAAHRGGKDMFYNSENGYYILYTNRGSDEESTWSIRSENEELIWVETTEENGLYPPSDSSWDLMNFVIGDLEVYVHIECSDTFSPSTFPTPFPSEVPTMKGTTLQPTPMPTALPTSRPTDRPTLVPTAECTALVVVTQSSEVQKYEGTYARLDDTKNGKTQWVNYETGGDLFWIDRGIWASTWMMRASDGEYLLLYDENADSNHPALNAEWMFPGREFILHGEMFQELIISCTTQPPAPAPTVAPTLSPTCIGNAIHLEDPCSANVTGGEYAGYYNYEYTLDGKNVYVRVDGEYEVVFVATGLYKDNWVIRSHNSSGCDEFWVVGGYTDEVIPPADAFWESYSCGCVTREYNSRCNFRIRCMHTRAPIPTEHPTSSPTLAPVDTELPSSTPTSVPTPSPTADPTSNPTPLPTDNPTFEPTTGSPTTSPVAYECTPLDLQPCGNETDRSVIFTERDDNQVQVTSNYYETHLYTEQKGYSFVTSEDVVMYEAGMAFTNLASYQSITVRVFNSTNLLYESDYPQSGKGVTRTTGSPRGDYYTFREMNVQLDADKEYTIVFVVHCPATKSSRAEYPL